MRISTGEKSEELTEDGKDRAASLGRRGGTARAKSIGAERRAEID